MKMRIESESLNIILHVRLMINVKDYYKVKTEKDQIQYEKWSSWQRRQREERGRGFVFVKKIAKS